MRSTRPASTTTSGAEPGESNDCSVLNLVTIQGPQFQTPLTGGTGSGHHVLGKGRFTMVRRDDTLTRGHSARPVGIVAGFALKTARRTASMTQEQLAALLRVDVSTIQGWESGRRPLAAAAAGDVMGVSRLLARAAAPATVAGHIHQAIAADLILSCGLRISGELAELDQHPQASTVLRRTEAGHRRMAPAQAGHLPSGVRLTAINDGLDPCTASPDDAKIDRPVG
ncbi:helix-turn-helix transcriptional regulator [Pseudonocardia sp. NPDC046786]|uniref:helix-turn-helix domain-containing protein n=1 Tax=Pseudonocardia sp. NPDC046786 TaxID=3155471 RepID=UPI0033E569E4